MAADPTINVRFRALMDGVMRIAVERARQRLQEGYDAEHDKGHADDLSLAAATYALPTRYRMSSIGRVSLREALWPWDSRYYKPTPNDRIRELEKAGALIAAAIDSLQAEQ